MSKMMKILLLMIWCKSALFSVELDDIDYNFLVSNPWTDSAQHFRKLFHHAHIGSLLEFGIGYSTKYLLDHCEKVTTCEILLPGQTAYKFYHILDVLGEYPNWKPILKHGNFSMQKANLFSVDYRKDPALQDATYILEIKEICDDLFRDEQFEVAFVDPGFHMRGDLVNELFDRVPIIVAHDTNIAPEIYGWNKIYTPSNYEKIIFTEGQGVTFWIQKDKTALISALGGRQPSVQPKKLRIFFPIMHHSLIESVALAFHHLGHTLVVPGRSFSPSSPAPGIKLSGTDYLEKNPFNTSHFISLFSKTSLKCSFLENVEVIENDEVIDNPPDVLVVNWEGVENGIYEIFQHLLQHSNKKDIKIVHYAGNNCTVYNKDYVKNLIALDGCTAQFHDPFHTNIISWIPWINFEALRYTGFSDHLCINNFISHYYESAFITSRSIFLDITNRLKIRFPQLEFVSPKFVPKDEVFSLLDQSCATFHIKESEGFGYMIIESIAKGRPVFLKRSFSLGSRLMNWCIEGKTAFFFDDYQECERKLKKYLVDQEYRHQVQNECASTVRKLINNEKQARILENFLQNLK